MIVRWCDCRSRRRAVTSCTRAIYALGYLLASAWRILAIVEYDINVALHAQVPPSNNMVVGSAVTMAGLKQALLGRRGRGGDEIGGKDGHRHLKIAHAQIFYPFTYEGLHDRSWDLVIIEGWFKMINAFIHEVRAIAFPSLVTILFYCLDPVFPGLSHASALDVDGFLTNSNSIKTFLLKSAPTALIPLAVDIKAFPFYPESPVPSVAGVGRREEDNQRKTSIVFVGAAGAMKYKEMLAWMLREALPYGLDIYGTGWQNVAEFSANWRGVLPEKDLALVYGAALAVIGVTADAQRLSGMINNRVFEALSVGTPLISDYFPALEALFGDSIFYVRQPGDVARHIERLLAGASKAHDNQIEVRARRRRRTIIEGGHSWAKRVEDILSFAQTLPSSSLLLGGNNSTTEEARCSKKQSCLSLAVVVDPDVTEDVTFETTFLPALDLLKSMYIIDVLATSPDEGYPVQNEGSKNGEWQSKERGERDEERWPMQLPQNADELRNYDVIWATGSWGGPADRQVRAALEVDSTSTGSRPTTRRLAAQLRGMVLWGEPCASNPDAYTKVESSEGIQERKNSVKCPAYNGALGLRWYDVVYCKTDWDHALLMRMAYHGHISNNLQQAWGVGRRVARQGHHTVEATNSNVSTSYDVLVVGTDDQIPGMLQTLRSTGFERVALAVIVPPGDAMVSSRPGLSSMVAAIGEDLSARGTPVTFVSDLPSSLSLFIVDTVEGSTFSPRPAHVILVRGAEDAVAFANATSVAAEIVVMATGQLRAWVTLVTAVNMHHGHWREKLLFQNIDDRSSSRDFRVTSLFDQRLETWDLRLYARRLIAGMTRAFCLGLGNSRISLVRPIGGETSLVGISDTVTVEVLVEDFDVGRDGQWCITANRLTLLCVLGSSLKVDVHITSSSINIARVWDDALETTSVGTLGGATSSETETEAFSSIVWTNFVRVELLVELRSNMYKDILFRGTPTWLLVDTSGSTAYGTGRCLYEETFHAVICKKRKEISDDTGGRTMGPTHDPYQTSLDVDNLLPTGVIVEIDVMSA